ncbi:MAG: HD domain-containing phosphohydrolase [Pseudomonadota bacterium]
MMERNRNAAIERVLALSDAPGYPIHPDLSDDYVVNIRGLSDETRELLLDRTMVIRYFPFLIGRFSWSDPFSFLKQDLSIRDGGQYGISRQHVTIERHGDKIVLVDEKSRKGSLVDSQLLGKRAGGRGKIELKYGKNKVILGEGASPFIFEMEVTRGGYDTLLNNYVRCGGHIVDVAALYVRLCQHAKDILTSADHSIHIRIRAAMGAIEGIAVDRETVNMLYCYSAHPDTFSDIIVAHSVNVAVYAVKLFASLSYPFKDIIRIGTAALLHDIGMYGIPKEIVSKEKPVSDKEYEIIKRHVQIGSEMLWSDQDEYRFFPVIARDHHERVNGSGYPNGIRNVSEITELMGVVDFFEAVTHRRPQRGPLTPHRGIRIIMDSREGVFSRKAIKSFINVFSVFPVYSVVRLNSGEIGQVVKANTNSPLRPIIKVIFGRDGQQLAEEKEINLMQERELYITKDISDRVFVERSFKL